MSFRVDAARPVLTNKMLEAGREDLFKFRTQPMNESECFRDSDGVMHIWSAIWHAST